ncbi:MAG TPA: hypothetical protein VFH73_17605 [Polyangia bacterium]|jgi:hypothetical protein|nr:hypothetical protein [Polyangia bacterium]
MADGAATDGQPAGTEAAAGADVHMDVTIATDSALDVAAEGPPSTLPPNGAPCMNKSECRSGFCVGGVCCAAACDNGCSACAMAKTGKPDGMCAADKGLDKQKCGSTCAQLTANVPAVLQKICDNGACVPSPQLTIVEICQKDDRCNVSFCDQSDANNARCVNSICPQQGNCCCGAQDGTRMCVQRAACIGDRSCQ